MGIVTGGIATASGVSKFFEGRKMQKEAQRLIDQFEWQDLNNPYRDLQVSTMGADLQREEGARGMATNVDALRSGGVRGIMGGLGRVQAQNMLMNRQIAADLDQQRKNIDYSAAQDDTRIRDMVENRQANELAGYGQMMDVGRDAAYQGIANLTTGLTQLGGGIAGGLEGSESGGGFGGFLKGSLGNPQGLSEAQQDSFRRSLGGMQDYSNNLNQQINSGTSFQQPQNMGMINYMNNKYAPQDNFYKYFKENY